MEASKQMLALYLTCALGPMLSAQMCEVMWELEAEKRDCLSKLENITSDCSGEWDLACWPSAQIGELVTIPCPSYFSHVSDQRGNISKTCTVNGWTEVNPVVVAYNCGYDPNVTDESNMGDFLVSVRIGYTVGHSVSLVSLIIAIIILCFFRKLHCTRNYIHIHLFMSFILKAVAVIMKDVVLYEVEEPDDCHYGSVGCKAAVVFFQYGVMASFFWLLVEGLYLHALLAVSFFSERKYFWWYILIGWGVPGVFITIWSITKAYLHDIGCWDFIDDDLWWIIKTPTLITILGFCVAVLYCFLNGEVQSEIKRKWRRWHMQRFLGADTKYHQPSTGSNGLNFSSQITMTTKCSPGVRRASGCQEQFSVI
ncbi:hypothetical protein DNTS_002787 [Danionella cerebrum]|uniref:G-protein coupled receptors family 2 profile 2 domain-containing protein n=1 Tax=Danionella cerebrum TaxID=2873325 RepID=A0A553MKW3_9TELE|nr:hypothetical protein DNTS_002787 [Danionella translucida]